jgi:hypothetical protein
MARVVRYGYGPKDWFPGRHLMDEVKVLFRKWRDGEREVVALFPEIPADREGDLCESYMHVGQHGAADPRIVTHDTRAANPEEYRSLLRELGQIGYTHLKVVERITPVMNEKRRQAAAAFR